MDRKALISLFIVASTLVSCMGQMELGSMIGLMSMFGGMTGGTGGLAGMTGAGGLANTQRLGGMGGMGGNGGMGGMGSMLASTMVDSTALMKLTQVVKTVLGPQANPNAQMLMYANAQQRVPANIAELVPYIEMMVELSKTTGILMPDGTVKRPAPANRIAYPATTGQGARKSTGAPTLEEVRNLVIQRGMMWMRFQ